MSGFSFPIADLAYDLTLAFGCALSLWFFMKQYLDCRVGGAAALLIYTLFTLVPVLFYSRVPVLARSLSCKMGTKYSIHDFSRSYSFCRNWTWKDFMRIS